MQHKLFDRVISYQQLFSFFSAKKFEQIWMYLGEHNFWSKIDNYWAQRSKDSQNQSVIDFIVKKLAGYDKVITTDYQAVRLEFTSDILTVLYKASLITNSERRVLANETMPLNYNLLISALAFCFGKLANDKFKTIASIAAKVPLEQLQQQWSQYQLKYGKQSPFGNVVNLGYQLAYLMRYAPLLRYNTDSQRALAIKLWLVTSQRQNPIENIFVEHKNQAALEYYLKQAEHNFNYCSAYYWKNLQHSGDKSHFLITEKLGPKWQIDNHKSLYSYFCPTKQN